MFNRNITVGKSANAGVPAVRATNVEQIPDIAAGNYRFGMSQGYLVSVSMIIFQFYPVFISTTGGSS